MNALLIVLVAVALVVGLIFYLLIGTSYIDASQAVQRSKSVPHPELIRDAVLAAETAHGTPTNTFAVQLAKLYTFRHVAPSRHLSYQLRELLLSEAIPLRYSRDEIPSAYLDNVYLGANAEGIEAGSRVYFGKSTQELDAAESALLAGLIRSPASYSPATHADRALQRRMLENGAIDQPTYQRAMVQPLRPAASAVCGQCPRSLGSDASESLDPAESRRGVAARGLNGREH